MISVGIHPPKTPVTKGSMGIAKATLPNVCKMPAPPAPFVPAPLPNIAKSGSSPKDFSTSVKIEGNAVAIRGAMFESMGDMASKGTGGGLISANTHGPAKFITPGSMTVKIEGKAVHLLSEPMLNNCGPSGSPPNTGATMVGLDQAEQQLNDEVQKFANECDEEVDEKWNKDHPNGPKNNDCWKPGGKGNYTSGDKRGEPMEVQVVLGSMKENCVYRKMGFNAPEHGNTAHQTKPDGNGNTVSIQERYTAEGKSVGGGYGGTGSFVPDIQLKGPDGAVAAVRDLKFPCPSKSGKKGNWSAGQEKKYATLLKAPAVPKMIFPI